MEINSVLLKSQLVISALSAAGPVGTAAATVNRASHLGVSATGPNFTFTLPTPTDTRAGRSVVVSNVGADVFFMYGVPIYADNFAEFMFIAGGWKAQSAANGLDFWRMSGTGNLPDGVADTTESVYHNGKVVVGATDLSRTAQLSAVAANADTLALENTTGGVNLGSNQCTLSFKSRYFSGLPNVVDQATVRSVKDAADGLAGAKVVIAVANSGNALTDQVEVRTTGQLKLNAYLSSAAFTGTGVGTLGYDSAGNVLSMPLAVGTIVGDIKHGMQAADHAGWIILDGRLKTTLTGTQQTQATTLGIGANLPDARLRMLLGAHPTKPANTIGGSALIAQNQLANVTISTGGANTGSGAQGTTGSANITGSGLITRSAGPNTIASSDLSPGEPDVITAPLNHNHSFALNGGVSQVEYFPNYLSMNAFLYLGL
jgi:hypothetical protein